MSRAIVWDDIRIRELVTQYEHKLKNDGIEYGGKTVKGDDAVQALKKLSVLFSTGFLFSH